ncbi:MAG: glutamate-5-semialdehyde dehydrogenase [Bacillota bacterium]
MNEIEAAVLEKAKRAKEAARRLAYMSTKEKDAGLLAMAGALEANMAEILDANARDLEAGRAGGLSGALLDRLMLNEARVKEMAQGLRDVVRLPDPVGEIAAMWLRPNGLQIGQMRVPLGVIGMIYEARPNVTVDAAGLCLKAGNAVVLRGGSEAIHSNTAITRIIAQAAHQAGIPEGAIEFIDRTEREAAHVLMRLNEYVDVLIPRGGAGLIQTVVKTATVPVIETGVGNCHIYVDEFADLKKAEPIVINAKCQRPGVCNAMETLLVHRSVAPSFLPAIAGRLKEQGVEIRGCPETLKHVPWATPAVEDDWYTEFLDLILAVRVVTSLDEAIDHIYRYGTKHSEAIITENYTNARRFLKEIDAAAVYVNASTRFTDGGQFGFGAEIGISTQKLHARGPMGLKELTTIKYIVFGEGQVRG